MPRSRVARWAAGTAAAVTVASLALYGAAERPRVHAEGREIERALLDATRAFVYEDLKAAREGMARIEAHCARLSPETHPELPREVVTYDRAFHLALDAAREHALRGNLQESFHQFLWIQQGCRRCHELAREQGLAGVPGLAQERQSRG